MSSPALELYRKHLNEDVNVAGDWFQMNCPTSGVRNVADTVVSGGPTTFTIDPVTDFAPGEICTTTVFAAQITDLDTIDPPDNMADDFTFNFTTDAAPTVSSTVPTTGATGVAVDTSITVNFSESVAITASTFALECPAGTQVPFAVSPAPPGSSFMLNPNADIPGGTACTIKVTASTVTDIDTNDPPDTMVTDFTSTFTTLDVNDPPQPSGGPFSIGENSANGSAVGTVVANDPDVGQTHTFTITGGNTGNAFAIDSSTGAITVNDSAALDFETTPTFGLTVQVTDNGSPPTSPATA